MKVVYLPNSLVAYFTHNIGKVPVVDPPEFQHFSLLAVKNIAFVVDKLSQTLLRAIEILQIGIILLLCLW